MATKKKKSKPVYIGLAALAPCPMCTINWMPYMNMKCCQDCAIKLNINEWTGQENDIIKHVKVRRHSTKK